MSKIYVDQSYQGTLTTEETVVTIIPDGATFIIKGFFVSNNNAEYKAFTMKIGNHTRLAANHPVRGNDTTIRDNLHIPLQSGAKIIVSSEIDEDMDYYIWGVMET